MVDIGLDIEDVRHCLQPLIRGRGYISIMSQPAASRSVRSDHFTADQAGLDQAVEKVTQLESEVAGSIWVRQTTIRELPPRNQWGFHERGTDELTASIIKTFLDVDCGKYHAESDVVLKKRGGLQLPADERAAIDFIEKIGFPEPTQVDFTGGGVNPYWHLTEPVDIDGDPELFQQAQWLYGTWQDIATARGRLLGVHYGAENRDLARVLRVPGTINRKKNPHEDKTGEVWPHRQAHTVFRDGPSYTFAELLDIARELTPKATVTVANPFLTSAPAPEQGKTTFSQPASGGGWVGGVAPGLDYRNKVTVDQVVKMFTDRSWDVVKEDGQYIYIKHPDATNEHSGTVDKATKRAWIFSGSTLFPANEPMNPEYVWALFNGFPTFNAEAARALKAEGYGEQGVRVDPPRPVGEAGSSAGDDEAAIEAAAWRSLDDIGNGERIRDLHIDTMRHIGDEDSWAVWDARRWGVDLNNAATEKAKATAEHMRRAEVPYLRAEGGEEPTYPDGYPFQDAHGENVPASDVLDVQSTADTLVDWVYDERDRVEWFKAWKLWESRTSAANALAAHAKKCRNMGPLTNMLKSASSLPGLAALRSHFDLPGSGVFVTPNVTIDTRTGETREHRQSDWNTRLCPVEYSPEAEAPLWKKFLERNVPDEQTRRYMQKLMGYAMTGDADQKLMVLLHSDMGDTGKSLFLNVVKATLGSDYAAGLAGSTLAPRKDGGDGGRDPDRHAMMGKRLLIGSEFRRSEPMDEAFMKRYTGRDPMSTRGNYSKTNTEWLPEGLIVIGTNKLFRIDLDDPAVWNRIVVVPFMVSFPKGHPERDDDLERKITAEERAGVLAWLVEGLRLYREEGLFPSAEITMATANYKSNSDHVSKWIEAAVEDGKIRLIDDGTGSVLTTLWEEFERWCKTERIHTDLAMGTFKKRLIELGYTYGPITSGPFKGRRVMKGIELMPSASDWQMSGRGY